MYAVRLEEEVNDKDVVIPFHILKPLNHQQVEIIIISKSEKVTKSKPTKFAQIFAKYEGVEAFSDIENSVEWQKRARDEWS